MSWNRDGHLICDCCGKTVIPSYEVTDHDLKENTGQTICMRCYEKAQRYQAETD